jgi:hypothetical protein
MNKARRRRSRAARLRGLRAQAWAAWDAAGWALDQPRYPHGCRGAECDYCYSRGGAVEFRAYHGLALRLFRRSGWRGGPLPPR